MSNKKGIFTRDKTAIDTNINSGLKAWEKKKLNKGTLLDINFLMNDATFLEKLKVFPVNDIEIITNDDSSKTLLLKMDDTEIHKGEEVSVPKFLLIDDTNFAVLTSAIEETELADFIFSKFFGEK